MKYLLSAMALAVFAGSFAIPTLALAADMDPKTLTCKDFAAMDSTGMMSAMEAMHKASPDAATEMDEAAEAAATAATMKACDGHPDMMAMEAMMMK